MKKTVFYGLAFGIFLTACSGRKEKEINDPISGKLYEKYEYIETDEGSFKKDGFYKKWFSSGQIALDGNYEENRKTDEWKVYYKDGGVKEIAHYVNDTLHGQRQLFHSNGEKSFEAEYVMGKKQGAVKEWHENGQVKEDFTCLDGLFDGKYISYFSDGQKFIESEYSKGQLNGAYHRWNLNGKDEEIAFYKDNKLHGEFRSFYKNGTPRSTGTYKDGLKDGLWKSYSGEDNKETEELYEAGQNTTLVGKWKINDSYTIEYFKDGSAIRTSQNGEESKSTYSISGGYLKWGYNRYEIIELTTKSYKVKERKFWGDPVIYHGIKMN